MLESQAMGSGPIKVLQVAGVDHSFNLYLRALIDAMQAEGWQVDIAATASGGEDELRKRGFRVFPVPYGRMRDVIPLWRRLWMLVHLMRRERYHVVHTHNPLAAFVGRIAARITRVPIVVYTVHGFNFHEYSPPLRRFMSMLAERVVGRWTHLVFSQSKEDYELIVRERIVKPGRALWIGNGIDPAVFDPDRFTPEERRRIREELGIPESARVAGMLTRYSYEKGMFEFLRAASAISQRMRDAWFMIVGGAIWGKRNRPTDEILRAYAEEHGVSDRLILPGFRKDAAAMMAAMDVFCLPSYREGLPRSIIEAMAMKLPVVATDIRGCREEVMPDETGFLVPPRDADELALAMERLLADKELSVSFGKRAREIVLRDYVESDVVRRQVEAIKRAFDEYKQKPTSEANELNERE